MVKVKMFELGSLDGLETKINNWLANHRYSDILNIQYAIYEGAAFPYSVCISYSDGS